MESLRARLTVAACLPEDHGRAMLIGRAWLPAVGGPALVRVTASDVLDLSGVAATSSGLLEQDDPVRAIRGAGALDADLRSHLDGNARAPDTAIYQLEHARCKTPWSAG